MIASTRFRAFTRSYRHGLRIVFIVSVLLFTFGCSVPVLGGSWGRDGQQVFNHLREVADSQSVGRLFHFPVDLRFLTTGRYSGASFIAEVA